MHVFQYSDFWIDDDSLSSSNNYCIFIFQDKTSLLDKMQEEKIEQLVSFNKMSIVRT